MKIAEVVQACLLFLYMMRRLRMFLKHLGIAAFSSPIKPCFLMLQHTFSSFSSWTFGTFNTTGSARSDHTKIAKNHFWLQPWLEIFAAYGDSLTMFPMVCDFVSFPFYLFSPQLKFCYMRWWYMMMCDIPSAPQINNRGFFTTSVFVIAMANHICMDGHFAETRWSI